MFISFRRSSRTSPWMRIVEGGDPRRRASVPFAAAMLAGVLVAGGAGCEEASGPPPAASATDQPAPQTDRPASTALGGAMRSAEALRDRIGEHQQWVIDQAENP
jgi:hypothetical protein